MNTVMNLRVPLKAGNFQTSLVTISFSRRTLLHGVSQPVTCGLHASGLGQGPAAGSCEHGNDSSDSKKWGNLLTS
jgi:hypothetical protein